jgi:hypothetical protein
MLLTSVMGHHTHYHAVPTKIDEILNLRQLVQLPIATESLVGKSSGSASVLPEAAAATKPKKPQPKGLRMRYRPSGFGPEDPGIIGSSDSDEPRSRAQFRAPSSWNGHSKPSKKRKDREEDTAIDANEKAHKKMKKPKDGQIKNDSIMENTLPTANSEKTHKTKKHKERPEEIDSNVEDVVQQGDSGIVNKKKKKKHKDSVDEDAIMEDVIPQVSQPQTNGMSKKSKHREAEVSLAPKVNGVHHATVDDTERLKKKDKDGKKKKKRDKENA